MSHLANVTKYTHINRTFKLLLQTSTLLKLLAQFTNAVVLLTQNCACKEKAIIFQKKQTKKTPENIASDL